MLKWFNFLKQKQDEFLACSICQKVMLIAPEARKISKLVKDFLKEPLEKTVTTKSFAYYLMQAFFSGIF